MSEMEKLADELARVTGEGSDREALACLVRNLPTILASLRQHATALEIGRGMGRADVMAFVDDLRDRCINNGTFIDGPAIAALSEVKNKAEALSPALDVEALVERVFKTIVASEVVDEINPAYVDQFWEDRNGVHSGDCTKQAHTCLRCRAEAHEQLARAVIAGLGVGE